MVYRITKWKNTPGWLLVDLENEELCLFSTEHEICEGLRKMFTREFKVDWI